MSNYLKWRYIRFFTDAAEEPNKWIFPDMSAFLLFVFLRGVIIINLIFIHVAKSVCSLCSRLLLSAPQELIFLFLCRHVVHASCVSGGDNLPLPPDSLLRHLEPGSFGTKGLSGTIALYVSGSPILFLFGRSKYSFFFLYIVNL